MIYWILIIIAAIVAIFLALFQYDYIFSSKKSNRKPWFAALRAITVFSILLLIISPKFEQVSLTTVKPKLLLMVDDSRSISYLNADAHLESDVQELLNDVDLKERFDLISYSFGPSSLLLDSLSFNYKTSNIAAAISEPQELYKRQNKALVLMTDGNQTVGSNYNYSKVDASTHIYPVVYGDTTQYPDLYISQLNVNRYSYLDNEYPVEIFVNYTGKGKVDSKFTISNGSKTLYQERLSFDNSNKSVIVTAQLQSDQVGLQRLTAQILPINEERNIQNNKRNFAVEVIDQKSRVLIISNITHPDIAALKNAISSNRQRSVDVHKPTDSYDVNDYNLVILYGMDPAFAKANSTIASLQKNTWQILGPTPNLPYLNATIDAYQIEVYKQTDEVQPVINDSYPNFNLDSFNYDDYPPVTAPFGQIKVNAPSQTLFYKQIGAVVTRQPLWFTYEQGGSKHAVFAASGLWRWRSQSYLDTKEFKNFDDLINSQVQLLASNERRDRLEIRAEAFYYENDKISINAQLLNDNYELVDNGVLNIKVINEEEKTSLERPFILNGFTYNVDLSGLPAGDYSYEVAVKGDNIKRIGTFTILDFDIEQQFVSSNYQGLSSIATNDKVYLRKDLNQLKTTLLEDPLLQDLERSEIVFQSLIDWKILLFVIALLLALEWLLRKYNGLI